MATFLEFIRKVPPLEKTGESGIEREQWQLWVGDYLVGLYRKLHEKPMIHLRGADIDAIDEQCQAKLQLHVAYDWTFADGSLAHASVLSLDGVPVAAWRKQGQDGDMEALILLEPNACTTLARWVYEIAGRHASSPGPIQALDVNAWLWQDNPHLAPAGSDDSFFYTVLHTQALSSISQMVTERSYVPTPDGDLLPIYGLGGVQPLRGIGREGLAAVAHTLSGPRSVDVCNVVHSVFSEENVRGQDIEALQKRMAQEDHWFLATIAPQGKGWACVVGVHRKGRVYLQWHVLHWPEHCRYKMVEWSHRMGERQPGVWDANVIATMEWQQGE